MPSSNMSALLERGVSVTIQHPWPLLALGRVRFNDVAIIVAASTAEEMISIMRRIVNKQEAADAITRQKIMDFMNEHDITY